MTAVERVPCVECGWDRCRSYQTWACWIRCCKRALAEHNYVRAFDTTRSLRAAGIPLITGPQTAGGEAYYAPQWAIDIWTDGRKRGARTSSTRERLRADARNAPVPPALLERLDTLRSFAILRGWQFRHGAWYRK